MNFFRKLFGNEWRKASEVLPNGNYVQCDVKLKDGTIHLCVGFERGSFRGEKTAGFMIGVKRGNEVAYWKYS